MTASAGSVQKLGFDEGRRFFAQRFRAYRWLLGNLSDDQHRDIYVVVEFLMKALETLSERQAGHATAAKWDEIRDELRQAVLGQSQNPLATAVTEVANRRSIAKQWLFDVLDGVDLWIRFRKFQSFDELSHFACKVGGGTVNILVPILEFERPGYESLAARAGTAMALTQILAQFHADAKHDRCLIPLDMRRALRIDVGSIANEEQRQDFSRLIRELACRTELLFFESAPLLNYLSFDGQRVLRSVWEWHWELLNKLKQQPLAVLTQVVELNRGELAKLRWKHLLGTEGTHVPFAAAAKEQHPTPGHH